MELGTEHGLALKQEQFMKQQSRKAQMRSRAERRKDLADACLKMRIDVTLTFPSTDDDDEGGLEIARTTCGGDGRCAAVGSLALTTL